MKKTKQLGLQFIWNIRIKLRAKGSRLTAKGSRLWAKGDRLWAKGSRLRAEGDRLWAEGSRLWAEGDRLWAEAIIEVHGNIKLEWKFVSEKNDYECHLETGEVFKP